MTRATLRRGSVSVVVLVCLVLVTAIAGALLRVGLAERARLAGEERRLQAGWLAESALERAAARLAASRGEYRGETWDLSSDELGGPVPGRVSIAIEPVDKDSRRRRIRVQADYPREATLRARVTRVATVDVGDRAGEETP